MNKLNEGIFKAYDVRGIYPTELDDQSAKLVALALAEYVSAKKLIVGRDMRVSSPSLKKSVVNALTMAGVSVVDIGMVSTDCFYFACASLKLPGIMITASHNPKEYNGLKMVKQMPYLIGGGAGMEEIKDIAMRLEKSPAPKAKKKGKVIRKDFTNAFVKKLLSLIDPKRIAPLKVVADASNGMAGVYLKKVFAKISAFKKRKPVEMFFKPDGKFPNHGANPLLPENRAALQARVIKEKADIGLIFDADVDRFFVIDDKGRFVSGDFLTALLAQYFLNKHPKSKIVYDLRSSWAVPHVVRNAGGTPLINRVGHAYIKRRMADENAIFGGEVTGHYYFRDFYNADSGLLPAIIILQILSECGCKMSEMHDGMLAKYFISGEINVTLSSPEKARQIFDEFALKYKDGKVSRLDGISVEYPDWHFNVRSSNTEPLMRLNVEALNKESLKQKQEELLRIINK